MKWFWLLMLLLGCAFSKNVLCAESRRREAPASATSVKPVNVPPVPFRSVSGTVTVRLNGLLVDPQSINYLFSPEFPVNTGRLKQINQGTYYLQADNVPADQPYSIRVTAAYNDAVVGRDGVIERRGRSYSGVVTIYIPYGTDRKDFGVSFLDLR